jgi:hypothetical protein
MALQLFKIETVEVASPVTEVTFSSIPSGYTDLKLVVSSRRLTDSANNDAIGLRFNGLSTSIYSARNLKGEGSGTPTSSTAASVSAIYGYGSNNPAGATASTFSNVDIYIPNYASSNAKSVSIDGVTENNATAANATLTAGLSTDTAAITSITVIALSSGTIATNSTFTLYGVL